MRRIVLLGVLLLAAWWTALWTNHAVADDVATQVRFKTTEAAGLRIFYREAGPRDAPVILLLHGFPSSSFMYRNLMPLLASRYRVIAPDYPGFGQSSFPDARSFAYTFEHLSTVMDAFTESIGANRYAMYIQDYGAPIGLRMFMRHPERVSALIIQNGNAYEEGLSPGWLPLRTYWRSPTAENRNALRAWLTESGIRDQYIAGVPASLIECFSLDTWTLDWFLLQRPGNLEMQLDLFADYRHNVTLYPQMQRALKQQRVPTLITWGRHDVFFTTAGAQAYLRDLPDAELHWLDTGHFALETHAPQIAELIVDFMVRRMR